MRSVSIIIPCLNEAKTIETVLSAIFAQDYPRSLIEVIIADGRSDDGTLDRIQVFKEKNPDLELRVVTNESRKIPVGLNLAIREAKNDIIVRMDAHSLPRKDYISKCLTDLLAKKGDNVGGRWEIIPGADTWVARGIAAAAAHPLGVGNVRYRISGEAGPVDTVPFGSYFRDLFNRIGLFDESLLTNEDYELNTRIRLQGGLVWFDPEIVCQYFSRPTLQALARQYWRYGYWKARMIKRYPASIKPRQLMPPVFVMGLILSFIASFIFPSLSTGLLAVFLLYLCIITVASFPEIIKRKDLSLVISMPIAIMTMHITWGSGFIASIFGF